MYSTAEQLCQWVDEALARKSDRTREQYKYVIKRLYASAGDIDLTDLKPKHVREFYRKAGQQGLAQNSLRAFDIALRAIFGRLEREGKSDFGLPRSWQSPMKSVEREREQEMPKQPLSKAELHTLLDSLPRRGFVAQRNYAIVSFLIMTGVRQTELRFAQLSRLDLAKQIIDLQITKGGSPRFVYLPQRLTRVLATYLRKRPHNCDLLFPTANCRPITRTNLTRFVRQACKNAGIPIVGPHRLRHSFITHSLNDGAPLKFVQDTVGHKNVKTTMRYNHVPADVGVELADKFNPLRG